MTVMIPSGKGFLKYLSGELMEILNIVLPVFLKGKGARHLSLAFLSDLSGIRDPVHMAALPEREQEEILAYWARVDALLAGKDG